MQKGSPKQARLPDRHDHIPSLCAANVYGIQVFLFLDEADDRYFKEIYIFFLFKRLFIPASDVPSRFSIDQISFQVIMSEIGATSIENIVDQAEKS